jgi:acyl carrier protein
MNQDQLQQWLIHHIADYLAIPATDIDPATPLTTYGLDSTYALTLAADLADTFGLLTEPHLAWQHPTINALAQHLANTTSTQ